MTSPHVFTVTAAEFETKVVAKSQEVPVLLDFWADWCQPCKALTPVLERLADEYGGSFVLAKVDTEAEQDLAYAFQVTNIPYCILLIGGRPVDAFAGAVGEREVRSFLGRGGVRPVVAEEPEDPDGSEARLRDGRAAAARGDIELARERLGGIPEEEPLYARAVHILDGLEILEDPPADETGPAAEALAQSREAIRAGSYEPAVEALLASVAADKSYRSELARRAIVLALELMDDEQAADRISGYRRRLATLLY